MELYIHFPFCVRKCEYCAFTSFTNLSEAEKNAYIPLLLKEAGIRRAEAAESPIQTVYFGGGTPSVVPASMMETLINGLHLLLPRESVEEFTVEANPGTVTGDWLQKMHNLGVNRLSIGMQAYQDTILERLGRIHRFPEVMRTVNQANEIGFNNISLDLIFGIPGQSMSDWEETIDAALSLNPAHISAYGLIPEAGTPLYEKLQKGIFSLPDSDLEREMYDKLILELKKNGFHQYEISNFSKDGYECRHNIGYWNQTPYIGLGVSAASMVSLKRTEQGLSYIRRTNPETFENYRNMLSNASLLYKNDEHISPKEARFETIMLGLRMTEGISAADFYHVHNINIEDCYGTILRRLRNTGLLTYSSGRWRLTRRGMAIQNSILVEFMEAES